MKALSPIAPLFILAAIAHSSLPEEYAVTDISGWGAAQLAAIPYFDRYVPAGASGDYSPVAQSGFGVTAGNRNFNNGAWVQGSGAFLKDGAVTDIPAWLRSGAWYSYSWSRTWWDGDDYHFLNGFVTHSPVLDVNALGQIVGYATVPGSGDSASGHQDHAYLHDTTTGERIDLTPDADRAQPNAINDLGEIAGTWSNASGSHPFRRAADGTFTDFVLTGAAAGYSMTPTVLNNRGQAAGSAVVYTVPERDRHPWLSESGTSTVRLPLPPQNSPDTATVSDLNEHGVLVGVAAKAAAPNETSGVRWGKAGGSWQVDDLNELLADHEPQAIIDRAIAINDAGHIIASGHLDGSDVRNTHQFLLSPDLPSKPAVSPLRAVAGATTATLRAKINAAGLATDYSFLHSAAGSGGSGSGSTSGTAPAMAELVLTGLTPNTTYTFNATATNSAGTTTGLAQSFTTLWDWPSWSADRGIGSPNSDTNGNGLPDLVDFATGSDRPPSVDVEAGVLKLSFRRALDVHGVELKVEVSDDLAAWTDAPATQTIRLADGSGGERVTVYIEAATQRRFARLTAVLP